MIQSIVQQRGHVAFPAHTGERIYMHAFRKETGLPVSMNRWQSVVDAMLEDVDTDGPIYLMVDQGVVKSGASHRRPGLHIDGYWVPDLQAWQGGSTGWVTAATGRHDTGGHRGIRGTAWEPEGIMLASDVSACRAMSGEFDGIPREGGDCSHIDASGLTEIILKPNTCYAGNVTMLHESLPVDRDCLRTLVRLNVPGWTPAV